MQAHHAISAKGVSLTSHGDQLEDFGYDINAAKNLVFIPCTLQGACLLQVQPHRGNHTAVDPLDDDNNKDPPYHDRVMQLLNVAMEKLERLCGKSGVNIQNTTQDALDKISAKIIHDIQHNPKKAKLTGLYNHFQPGELRGCRGVDTIRAPAKKILDRCPVHRDHFQKQATGQNSENMTYRSREPYNLTPGK